MLCAQSTPRDYITAKHKLQSISKLFIPQVIIPQVFFSQTTAQILSTIFERKTKTNKKSQTKQTITYVLETTFREHSTRKPASSRVTYYILRAYTAAGASHSLYRKKSVEVLEKMQVNGPEGQKLAGRDPWQ